MIDEEFDLDEEDEESDTLVFTEYELRSRTKMKEKNKAIASKFLGGIKRVNAVVVQPRYFAGLLAWALARNI